MRLPPIARALRPAAVSLLAVSAALAGKAIDIRAEAFKLLNEGVAAYEKGDYAHAVVALSKCANEALNSFRAYYFLGLAETGDHRYTEAIESLKVALDLDPDHLQANVALGDAWLLLGSVDEASPPYYRALKLRAEFPAALDGLARVAEAQGDDEKAIAFYGRAIASDKGYAPAYTHWGDLYLRTGKLDDAVKLLVEAISVRPDFAAGLNRLAIAYGRLGFANEAVATIRKAIALEPKSPEHRAMLGQVLLGMGVVSGAESAFGDALALDPADPHAHAGLAEIARRRGDFVKAVAQLDLALADTRLDRRTRADLTATRAKVVAEGERSAAIEAKVASADATAADRTELATILAGRGDWTRAADVYAAASPAGADRETLAYYFFRAGRFREAYAIYADLASAGGRADLEVDAGASLARLGDDARAKDAFERALAIDPERKEAKLYLGNALLRLGKTGDAIAAYRKFLTDYPEGPESEQVRRVLGALQPAAPAAPAAPAPPAAGVKP